MTQPSRLVLPLLALTLSACGSLVELGPQGPPPAIYSLDPLPRAQPQAANAPRIRVEEPILAGALDSQRLAIRRADRTFAYLAGVRWDDPAARMLQRHLAHSLDNLPALAAIGTGNGDLPADYRLRLDVRHFNAEAVGGASPRVRIAWLARIVAGDAPEVIASRYFETVRESASDAPLVLAGTVNAATNALTREMADWIADAVSGDGTGASAGR